MKDHVFETKLIDLQKTAWNSFKAVVDGFLVSRKLENYKELENKLISDYEAIAANLLLKMHILHSHICIISFLTKFADGADEHGKVSNNDVKENITCP